ncbi:Uncharacterized membrane protein [Mameliella alba]|uniref:NnrU family protein n=1 Tax=Mameliella alba TaxID=561184 RepID=UPI0008915B1F|nr:NnrU family protein [Mameliella alba]OWV44715.1 NnrU family protein [Mameliella alba]PTR36578.1 putative membrane protein [Mameliella alba]GGF78949.1 hypothetical protein GCM10011319_43950 [Mameliella alba]SDC77451.1 Uncharacterized membrane protein [Mameliella alba]
MSGWTEFALAMTAFVGSHFLPRLWGLREKLIGSLGRRIYFSLYGLLSLAILAWVIGAAGRAPYVELWPQTGWGRWVPNIAMPVALVLTALGVGIRQPHTLGARRGADFNAEAPGLAAVTRHPLLLALALWSLAHLFPNGDLAHVMLFGGFAALSLAAIPLFDARARRDEGKEFFDVTAILSLRPLLRADWWRSAGKRAFVRVAGALVLWIALLHAHATLFGAAPFPG